MAEVGSGERLRLLHWNIHSWIDPEGGDSNVGAVIDVVRRYEPDVVSLVEVDETWHEPSRLRQVAAVCGYASIFVPCFQYGSDAPSAGFGNAILTRLPIESVDVRQLTWPTTVYESTEPSEVRLALWLTVRLASGRLAVVGSTHLPARSEVARLAAGTQLLDVVGTLADPWLVCGDFNMSPKAWIAAESKLAVAPAEPTYPTALPSKSIDYVVAAPGIHVEARVVEIVGSDHLAVLAEAEIN